MATAGGEAAGRPHRSVRRRPTMRDVAARAGVSFKTVSRVFDPEGRVSPEKREAVLVAARELRYQPDPAARNLRQNLRRSHSLGVVLSSVDNPFASAVHRAVQDVAEERGFAVFSASTDDDPERERPLVEGLIARRVDGRVLTPTAQDQSYLAAELRDGTPVVGIDRTAHGLDLDTVVVDNVAGARDATEHLLDGGHSRVAYLGDLSTISTARDRRAGYEAALRVRGIAVDPALVRTDLHDAEAARRAASELLAGSDRPTAFFASQNTITIGLMRALRDLRLDGRVALVGFDDFPLADLVVPAVTVVAQDPRAIGRAAAERLFERIGGLDTPATRIVLPTTFVVRGSGEIPPDGSLRP